MKASLASKLDQLTTRRAELERLLSDPEATADLDRYRKLTREHSELGPLVESHTLYQAALADERAARDMQGDPEMKAFAEEELTAARARIAALDATLQRLLLPKDPDDSKPMFLEVRAGTGGDESALFAGNLLRMYTRYAERHRWQVEIVSSSPAELGGYKEAIVRISPYASSNASPNAGASADDLAPYARLKFESGGHRVQRVPVTETQGRIHTSACTLAVMPEADDVAEVDIRPDEIRIDTFRASGAGGQHINKTDSAVRITHLPTGIVVECQDDRSQHKNKAQALKVLAARIKDRQTRERQAKEAATRKSLIGSGDRSERIRTYNFPQGRVTDHRINLTLYKLELILDGDLDELTDALVAEHQAELLAALGDT
ncbi:MAG: peptide chain release factor 1 [Burkholderiaceae bacterium]